MPPFQEIRIKRLKKTTPLTEQGGVGSVLSSVSLQQIRPIASWAALLEVKPVGPGKTPFPLPSACEMAFGVQCSILGSPVQEGYSYAGASPVEATGMTGSRRARQEERCSEICICSAWRRDQTIGPLGLLSQLKS